MLGLSVVLTYDCLDYIKLMNVWIIFGFHNSVIFSYIQLCECYCVYHVLWLFDVAKGGEKRGLEILEIKRLNLETFRRLEIKVNK